MKTLPDGPHAASPLFGDLLWSIMHLCGTPLTINKCLLCLYSLEEICIMLIYFHWECTLTHLL